VETHDGQGEAVLQTLKEWKADVRAAKGFGVASVDGLCDKVRAIAGVARVVATGPRSALPLALRMACGLTGGKGRFACHIGKGILSDGIRGELTAWNIELDPCREL
jgi:hypothetical protein